MSSKQVQRCLIDVLRLNEDGNNDWSKGHLKKMLSATSTLYNASLGKVMLKQDEETARCHICAFIAAERLMDKYDVDLTCSVDKVPMQPKKFKGFIELFKQNIFQTSPVKQFNWTPSPKKRPRSPVKSSNKFTSTNPEDLRKVLFNTPTKRKNGASPIKEQVFETPNSSPGKNASPRVRRKLAFEEDVENDEMNLSPVKNSPSPKKMKTLSNLAKVSNDKAQDNDDYQESESNSSSDEDLEPLDESEEDLSDLEAKSRRRSSTKGTRSDQRGKKSRSRSNVTNLLRKRHFKIKIEGIINLCNEFELPEEVAYSVLDEFTALSSYLVCPWQLACGLVLNCVFVVYNEKRRKDPRLDHLILEKMCILMKTVKVNEVMESMTIVKELIEGEKWFRELQIKYDYFDGANYEESISAKLGSMLQSNNILVSDDQYNTWLKKIKQDLSLIQNN
ncbi:hypothetical protein Kpol_1048p19 [Vanderwaltozyma polyspora DSM 70294]|uniref:ORC6 first cyclin-like domain-containing protein n=1 Tax=Vanderwaltozyma polyspora (strain ATCC 22028 / DSM 70294 / BCRC 21397 / CBS 2163 / NBRC 10782 / NRRL Y-8283 / UCD 57-17) TaxID=436907 RepID=A7TGI2_VANPO|nr:uncharacterized protein Kpol_1048p19 [Vanderwaltozyma polyspora DSM 70294]EDO18589.1 hypothetical protein Kpol_1048p19 [Vanderwaltozyma polyspora DSM 70294]